MKNDRLKKISYSVQVEEIDLDANFSIITYPVCTNFLTKKDIIRKETIQT
jgi:hypothetical protein